MSMEKYPEHRKRELLLSDRIAQNSVKYAIESIFDINAIAKGTLFSFAIDGKETGSFTL